MDKKSYNGRVNCLISAAIIFGIYILQKLIHIVAQPSKQLVVAEALVFTALLAVVYFLVMKSNEPFYGILTAIFGIRMMPPDIAMIKELSPEADMLYFLVKKAAIVIFLLAIVRLYEQQKKPRLIKPIPIICTIAVVPFVSEIQSTLGAFLADKTGTMLYSYFSDFALYSAAMIVLLFVASRTSKQGAQLICDFQLVALVLNLGRRIAAIIINTFIYHNHISRSYYCWIVIYIFFFGAFMYLKNKRKAAVL